MITSTKSWASPVMYKTTSSGALRQWRSWSEGNCVFTEFGAVGGKLQTSCDIVKGKGIGKAATTPQQQAAKEAEGLWDKQVKKGYMSDRASAMMTTNALPGILPMLAHVYEDVKNLVYPAFVQPKLDGVRCLAVVRNGKCTLYTRSQKIIDTVPHIVEAVEALAGRSGIDSFVCDGELYNHNLHDDFGRILGAIKRKGVGADADLVHYYVYDLTSEDPKSLLQNGFSIRTASLQSLMGSAGELPLVRVQTVMVKNEAEMYEFAKKCMAQKYEGAMYRSTSGLYEGKRSKHLLKVKTMKDDEFEVVGFQEGTGKLMGFVGSFHCKTKAGVEFKAKLEGKLDELPKFSEGKNYVGKILTVRFQDYTPDGAPRFPVGVRFKDGVES